MDDERLKNPDGRPDYFDELLARIRDIRASEKRFYQKVRDLFALSSDYDKTDKATQMFFAETQNKLLYAVTHQTPKWSNDRSGIKRLKMHPSGLEKEKRPHFWGRLLLLWLAGTILGLFGPWPWFCPQFRMALRWKRRSAFRMS